MVQQFVVGMGFLVLGLVEGLLLFVLFAAFKWWFANSSFVTIDAQFNVILLTNELDCLCWLFC